MIWKIKHLNYGILGLFLLALVSCTGINKEDNFKNYKNSGNTPEVRAQNLISLMSIEEKVAQTLCTGESNMDGIFDESGHLNQDKATANFPNGTGYVFIPQDIKKTMNSRELAEFTNSIQKFFMNENKYGIPVIILEDHLYEQTVKDGTLLPSPIGLGATWDPTLVEELFAMSAAEIRARGTQQVLEPAAELATKSNWFKTENTFGEDPFLVTRVTSAAIKGLQGKGDFKTKDHVIATLTHLGEFGQESESSNISKRVIKEMYLPPFQEGIENAGALGIMVSNDEIDGVSAFTNTWLIKDILREEWDFDGVVLSGYYGISDLFHKSAYNSISENKIEAAKIAFNAGLNLEFNSDECYAELVELVKSGEISENLLDEMVLPILKTKFRLGLFDDPFVDPDHAEKISGTEDNIRLAHEAALKSIVLLKNKEQILPLQANKLKTIAVIGIDKYPVELEMPNDTSNFTTSLLEEIKKQSGEKVKVLFARGHNTITDSKKFKQGISELKRDLGNKTEEVTEDADVILFVTGNTGQQSPHETGNSTINKENTDFVLQHSELLHKLKSTGKPVILVNNNPHLLSLLNYEADAILESWHQNQLVNQAIAEVLFGSYNPGGKLPVTIPKGKSNDNSELNNSFYPFGYGLSYTTFEISEPSISKSIISKDENVTVSLKIKNTGRFIGDEVIQLYIRDEVSSVTRPLKELQAFKRVTLNPKEVKTLEFDLTPEDLSFYNMDLDHVVESGNFLVMTGPDSQNLKQTILKVE